MEDAIREWISQILQRRQSLLSMALAQRAKFEGWLKFELAEYAASQGAEDVQFEAPLPGIPTAFRSDLAFAFGGTRYYIELKTPNTNWRMPGILNRGRPITKNVDSIIEDCIKLSEADVHGIVAFVMFPVKPKDDRWVMYFERIANELGLGLAVRECTTRVGIRLPMDRQADIIVATISIGD